MRDPHPLPRRGLTRTRWHVGRWLRRRRRNMAETAAGREERGGRGDRCRRTRGLPRDSAKDQNYRGSIQLASRHVKYYCPPRFIYSIFKRGERKALPRPPNIFHYWIILLPLPPWLGPFLCSVIVARPPRSSSRAIVPWFLPPGFARSFFELTHYGNPREARIRLNAMFLAKCVFLVILVNWLTNWPRAIK